jgi:hypothetical protein
VLFFLKLKIRIQMKILKIIIIAFLFTSLCFNSFGQKIGVKLGANRFKLNMDRDDATAFDHKTNQVNLHIGLTLEFALGNRFSIQPGILFSKKKVRYENKITPTQLYRSDYSPTFIDIPISLKYFLMPEKNRFYVFGGPFVALGVSGDLKIKNQIPPAQTLERYEIWGDDGDRLKKFDYGITVGTGIDINNFEMEFFYNYGIPDLANNMDSLASARTQSFGFSFSLKFSTKYE